MEDHHLEVLVENQRRELMAATQEESDLEMAFRLQLEEAMAASSVHQNRSLETPPLPVLAPGPAGEREDDVSLPMMLQDVELERFQLEYRDAVHCREEMQRISLELLRQAHDRRFARDLSLVPDDEWEHNGDFFERPIEQGFGEEESFRLYFKGLCEPNPGSVGEYVSALGVAICDPLGNQILKIQKPTTGPRVSQKVVETRALMEGLNAALSLGIRRLHIFFHHAALFNHINGRWVVKQHSVSDVIHQALNMLRKLETHETFLLPRCDIQFVFRLARDAIDAHLAKSTKPRVNDPPKENCAICMEDTDPAHILQVEGCRHRFCFACMRQHVQVKLLHGALPGCPSDGCKTMLTTANSRSFLTQKLAETMAQRIAEASIPPAEKIYCPYPRCSALMARSEAARPDRGSSSSGGAATDEPGLRKCLSCSGLFCIFCMVPWHFGISCNVYKWRYHRLRAEDEKLQHLASRSMWRRCVKCNHMIELASGCFHVTCRCGHEFCYSCGAEWKNKKATCSCPLWMERNIVEADDDDYESDDDW